HRRWPLLGRAAGPPCRGIRRPRRAGRLRCRFRAALQSRERNRPYADSAPSGLSYPEREPNAAMITRESRLFLRRWLHNPMQVGAIAPSSRRLADAIAGQVPIDSPGWVIELGGGTGVVTDALLRRGLAPGRLVVIERDPLLHRHLVERFPHVRVILGDAAKLAEALRPLGIRPHSAKGQA